MRHCADSPMPCRKSNLSPLQFGVTLLGSYGRLFPGAFMPVVESVAPDLGDCNHGGVACLGICFAEKGNALDPAEEIVSLSPPGRAGLILNTKVASYAADTKVTFRPNHSAAWRSTEPKRATQISTTDPVRQRETGDSPWKYCWH